MELSIKFYYQIGQDSKKNNVREVVLNGSNITAQEFDQIPLSYILEINNEILKLSGQDKDAKEEDDGEGISSLVATLISNGHPEAFNYKIGFLIESLISIEKKLLRFTKAIAIGSRISGAKEKDFKKFLDISVAAKEPKGNKQLTNDELNRIINGK